MREFKVLLYGKNYGSPPVIESLPGGLIFHSHPEVWDTEDVEYYLTHTPQTKPSDIPYGKHSESHIAIENRKIMDKTVEIHNVAMKETSRTVPSESEMNKVWNNHDSRSCTRVYPEPHQERPYSHTPQGCNSNALNKNKLEVALNPEGCHTLHYQHELSKKLWQTWLRQRGVA